MRKIRWYVSPFLVIMLVTLVALGYFYDCVIYFTTIVLHELAHADVAVRLGYALEKFKLMPFGASLSGQFEGARAKDEILIAIAGPLFNCVLAVICVAIWWMFPSAYVFTQRLVQANAFTAVFNLLPVFPLDGGRIAVAALSIKIPRQKAYKRIRVIGFVIAPVFAILFALVFICTKTVNFSFALISAFIFLSTIFPDKNSTYRRVYGMAYFSERLKRGLKVNQIMAHESVTLIELDRMLNSNYYTTFILVDDEMKTVGSVTETELEELLKKHDTNAKIRGLIK